MLSVVGKEGETANEENSDRVPTSDENIASIWLPAGGLEDVHVQDEYLRRRVSSGNLVAH